MYRVTRLNVAVERREYIMLYIKQQNKIAMSYMVLSFIFIWKFKTIKTSTYNKIVSDTIILQNAIIHSTVKHNY